MIQATNLCRTFGDFDAVRDVSFAVSSGEIMGMLGPNGAGKTTTIRMITGFLPPTAGAVTVAGHDLLADPLAARSEIGYLPENVALYPEMRVDEYLLWRARLHGLRGAAARSAVGRSIERCLISDVAGQIIATLSKGYRQRVGLAMAILHDPQVLILDEPTVGLDPTQIIAIRELIRDLGSEHTVLLSTHILPEVELLCQSVQIIDRGRILAQGTPDNLRRQFLGNTVLYVTVDGAGPEAAEALAQVGGVLEVTPDDSTASRFALDCLQTADPRRDIFDLVVARGWALLELSQAEASLEDVFVRLTTREDEDRRGEEDEDGSSDADGGSDEQHEEAS